MSSSLFPTKTSASVGDIGDPAVVLASAILDVIDPQQHQQPSLSTASSSKPTTRAYYRDSSGRARVHLRVRLSTPDGDDDGGLNALLTCGCISPTPVESPSLSTLSLVETSANGKMMSDGQNGNESEQLLADDAEQNKSTKLRPSTDLILSFECTTFTTPPPSSKTQLSPSSSSPFCWIVEGVTILRCEIERTVDSTSSSTSISALLFDIEIAVCGNGVGTIQRKNDLNVTEEIDDMLEEGILTISAALRRRRRRRRQPPGKNAIVQQQQDTSSSMTAQSLLQEDNAGGMVASLLGIANDSGMNIDNITSSSATNNNTMGTEITRTPPIHVHTTLIPSLQVSVREVCGARAPSGSTLVEITVEHASRWHQENVIVTGISFHPGQSRLLHWHTNNGSSFGGAAAENNESTVATNPQVIGTHGGKSMQGGELSVIDMSRRVRWGFVPGSAPDLPMTLEPYEAIATVIQIDAGEDVRSRAFLSPISVNATIPSINSSDERIMITTNARWTSSRVGIENSDAFRVDLSLRGGGTATTTVCRVGAPLVISIRILNLSMEPRDLMLLMAKDDEKKNRDLLWEQQRPGVDGDGSSSRRRREVRHDVGRGGDYYSQQGNVSSQPTSKASNIFNTAVVSEVNGYTFGVWGLSSEDDGTTRHHRDHELLAVDAALLLGEVKGQHSIQAELRFVPLREGTLDVPNLKLFDKRELKWYNCSHTLKILATQST